MGLTVEQKASAERRKSKYLTKLHCYTFVVVYVGLMRDGFLICL